ncbi:uncharacterized protein JCM10292_000932 [Rhodotorula paludigena]|uniref:uncharacterized protein n=1 Tax=Rhodotorula paludigena TaxID=86838 RepID=UPI00317317BB
MPALTQLLADLHALETPHAADFDSRTFIAVLLALASGHRALVLRVSPERTQGENDAQRREHRRLAKEWVKRVVDEVVWICTAIFAASTHRLKCSQKLNVQSFLKGLFLPPPPNPAHDAPTLRKDSYSSRSQIDGTRRGPKRSLTAPLRVGVPAADQGAVLDQEGRRARSPNKPDSSNRRIQHASDTGAPLSAPTTRLSFSPDMPYTGPSPEDGDSSAGEDMYPASPRLLSPTRRTTLSPRVSHSPDGKRLSTTRRHTLNARDLAQSLGKAEEMVGLGVGGSSAPRVSSLPAKPPRSPRSRESSGSGYFASSSPRSPGLPHAAHLQPADRRPSIASIQSGFSGSSPALPPSPTQTRFLTPPTAGPGAQPFHHTVSPLAASPSTLSPSDSLPARPSSPRRATPQPSSTYPPTSRPPPPVAFPSTSAAAPERTLPRVVVLEHLERARPSVQNALLGVLRDQRVTIAPAHSSAQYASAGTSLLAPGKKGGEGKVDDGSSFRTRRTNYTARTGEQSAESEGTWNLPDGFLCVAVVWEEDEGGKEGEGGWGGLSRHLLDRFTLSHTVPPSAFQSSSFHAPPLSHPLATPAHSLLSPLPLPPSALPSYISDALDTYVADLVSALRHHPQLDARMLTARAVKELRQLAGVWAALTQSEVLKLRAPGDSKGTAADMVGEGREGQDARILVLPGDVLAVVLSVLGHRLALRKPRDEKSLFWGSELGALEARRDERRLRVEEVVRDLVAVV